eukprot:1183995-Prorocentrum_minimum.AAC.1
MYGALPVSSASAKVPGEASTYVGERTYHEHDGECLGVNDPSAPAPPARQLVGHVLRPLRPALAGRACISGEASLPFGIKSELSVYSLCWKNLWCGNTIGLRWVAAVHCSSVTQSEVNICS